MSELPAPMKVGPLPSKPLPARVIAGGPFQPSWDSLAKGYQAPEWFRDAKFGIWAHWSAQCQPEMGDWYARHMYIQGNWQNESHLKQYGHPSEFGFKDMDHAWKAERWDPARLMKLYQAAGAKYFVALANHHDNFDNYDSKYHEWNSTRIGPKKDLIGIWSKEARKLGLRFGVSNHSAHAWHWFQTAYAYDPEGPKAGKRYDGWLKKEDGKGTWWEGLDPQELYTGPTIVPPDGIRTRKEMEAWQEKYTRPWTEQAPAGNPYFTDKWFLRAQDLIDTYRPDLVYFDNGDLPLGQAGLDIAAHYYNANMAWNAGKLEAVLNVKQLPPERRRAVVEDYERGAAAGIQEEPWQTDTCLGNWHYERGVYERKAYKSAGEVIRKLIDIVSKNGNLLLSVPLRGDGSLDEIEEGILRELAEWMPVGGEAVFGTRPWKSYGEGGRKAKGGMFQEANISYTSQDIRFTTKGGALYATALNQPVDQALLVRSLAGPGNKVTKVSLLGHRGKIRWSQDAEGLHVALPKELPSKHTVGLKIEGGPFEPSPAALSVFETPVQPPTPAGELHQAEEAVLSGGAHVAADNEGYLGKGFVAGFYEGFGQSVLFDLEAKAAGRRRALFRYSNGMGGRAQTLSLVVNGRTMKRLEFPPLASWYDWDVLAFDVDLKRGKNTIAVVKKDEDGCVNLDYLLLP